jgi:hypothetical protein
MGVLCAASYAELDDLSTSGGPKPQLPTSAESVIWTLGSLALCIVDVPWVHVSGRRIT